jgi:urea transport system ATP-binding protein
MPHLDADSERRRRTEVGHRFRPISKQIGRVIARPAERGDMAILLVAYFEFARDLASSCLVMQRGEIVLSGRRADMNEAAVRHYLTV